MPILTLLLEAVRAPFCVYRFFYVPHLLFVLFILSVLSDGNYTLIFVNVQIQGMCSIPFVFLVPRLLWLFCCNIKIFPLLVCISDIYINQVIHFYSLS